MTSACGTGCGCTASDSVTFELHHSISYAQAGGLELKSKTAAGGADVSELGECLFDRLIQWQVDLAAILFKAAFAGGSRVRFLLDRFEVVAVFFDGGFDHVEIDGIA